jgi:hypothetical protein
MPRALMITISGLLGLGALVTAGSSSVNQGATDNVVLVTLDGARTEEIFGGLQIDILKSTLGESQVLEESPTYRRFWAPTPEERRQKLMPFFWSLVTREGSIAGNRHLRSVVRLTNSHWFSYPGYSEILVGQPFDDVIKSNDAIRNPHSTVLEGLRDGLNLPAKKVATFASWAVFNEIVEHEAGKTFVNAGVESLELNRADVQTMNTLQRQVVTPWDATRFDAFTFHLAMAHLAAERPRVLYIAFDETDDWAHDGQYGRLLDAYTRTDSFLKELWTWLQNDSAYRGRTHLLITTDHGRGHTPADWRDHGAKVNGSQDVWIAFASPAVARRGEWGESALSTNQIAATLSKWLGIDWNATHPRAGKPIAESAVR